MSAAATRQRQPFKRWKPNPKTLLLFDFFPPVSLSKTASETNVFDKSGRSSCDGQSGVTWLEKKKEEEEEKKFQEDSGAVKGGWGGGVGSERLRQHGR